MPGGITKNQPNALTPTLHNLNVAWFQYFTILNKIDSLAFTTRKADLFFWGYLKEITPHIITCSKTDTLEHGVFIINFKHISHHVLVFLLFTLNR